LRGKIPVARAKLAESISAPGRWDRTARFWEAATGKPLGQPLLHQSTVETLTYSRDGRTISTSDGSGAVYFWEAATGKLLDSALQQQNGMARE
jgi:WD40 repeat protein